MRNCCLEKAACPKNMLLNGVCNEISTGQPKEDSIESTEQSSVSVTLSVQVHWQSDSQQTHREPERSSTQAERPPPSPSQGHSRTGKDAPNLSFIAFRRQELHNRRVLLMKTQQVRSRGKETGEGIPESAEPQELEAIQEELEKLVIQEVELLQMEGDFGPKYNSEPVILEEFPPHGGVYTLPHGRPAEQRSPPAPVNQEVSKPKTLTDDRMRHYGGVYVLPPPIAKPAEIASDPELPPPEEILEVQALSMGEGVVRCPSCENVVTTETYRKVGGAAWMLCLMATMFGCVAGCCLIPFLLPSLKDTHHRCPQCKAHIHTAERI